MSRSNENIRIAKNTLVVYARLIITAIIGLVTSRYVLQILGASDFGLYSVIGGIIALFTFISGSLQATSVRFINFEMGKPHGDLNEIFSTSRQIHIFFSLIIFVLAEIVGVLYILQYLNVAAEKIPDALYVFHVSLIATCLGIINIPYQGMLVAYERFGIIAVIDILNVIFKLLLVIFLIHYGGNALRLYALGMSLLTISSFLIYLFICKKNWPEVVKWKFARDKQKHKEMLIFNNYTLLTTVSLLTRNQGSNMLINFFFGTVVNAAYAISNTIHVYVNTFAGCFDQASSPQITQSLSKGDNERALYLVNHTCRICLLLVEIIYFIAIADVDLMLYLWLGDRVPSGTNVFSFLTLFLAIVSASSGGLVQYINAIGRLKWYSISISVLYFIALCFGLLLYQHGYAAYTIIILFIIADSVNRAIQLFLLNKMTSFPVKRFIKEAYLRPLMVFIIGLCVVYTYRQFLISSLAVKLIFTTLIGIIMIFTAFYIGLYPVERKKIISHIKSKFITK